VPSYRDHFLPIMCTSFLFSPGIDLTLLIVRTLLLYAFNPLEVPWLRQLQLTKGQKPYSRSPKPHTSYKLSKLLQGGNIVLGGIVFQLGEEFNLSLFLYRNILKRPANSDHNFVCFGRV
jgi:hypothetical protein